MRFRHPPSTAHRRYISTSELPQLGSVGVDDGLVRETPRQRTHVRNALAELLNHANEDEILDRIDPEPGSGGAAPVVLALGDAVGGDGVDDDCEIEAEAGAR